MINVELNFKFVIIILIFEGVTHNIPLLRDIITEENFVNGELSTKYLYKTYPNGFKGRFLSNEKFENLCSFAASLFVYDNERASSFLNGNLNENSISSNQNEWKLVVDIENSRNPCLVTVQNFDNRFYQIGINGKTLEIPKILNFSSGFLHVPIRDNNFIIQLISSDGTGKMKIQFEGTIVIFNLT